MTEPLYCWRCDEEVPHLNPTAWDADGLCDACEERATERAYERSLEDFYGESGGGATEDELHRMQLERRR